MQKEIQASAGGRSARRSGRRRRWRRCSARSSGERTTLLGAGPAGRRVGAFEGAMYEAKGYYRAAGRLHHVHAPLGLLRRLPPRHRARDRPVLETLKRRARRSPAREACPSDQRGCFTRRGRHGAVGARYHQRVVTRLDASRLVVAASVLAAGVLCPLPARAAEIPNASIVLEVPPQAPGSDPKAAAPPRFVLLKDGQVFVGGTGRLAAGKLDKAEQQALRRSVETVRKAAGKSGALVFGNDVGAPAMRLRLPDDRAEITISGDPGGGRRPEGRVRRRSPHARAGARGRGAPAVAALRSCEPAAVQARKLRARRARAASRGRLSTLVVRLPDRAGRDGAGRDLGGGGGGLADGRLARLGLRRRQAVRRRPPAASPRRTAVASRSTATPSRSPTSQPDSSAGQRVRSSVSPGWSPSIAVRCRSSRTSSARPSAARRNSAGAVRSWWATISWPIRGPTRGSPRLAPS